MTFLRLAVQTVHYDYTTSTTSSRYWSGPVLQTAGQSRVCDGVAAVHLSSFYWTMSVTCLSGIYSWMMPSHSKKKELLNTGQLYRVLGPCPSRGALVRGVRWLSQGIIPYNWFRLNMLLQKWPYLPYLWSDLKNLKFGMLSTRAPICLMPHWRRARRGARDVINPCSWTGWRAWWRRTWRSVSRDARRPDPRLSMNFD